MSNEVRCSGKIQGIGKGQELPDTVHHSHVNFGYATDTHTTHTENSAPGNCVKTWALTVWIT